MLCKGSVNYMVCVGRYTVMANRTKEVKAYGDGFEVLNIMIIF